MKDLRCIQLKRDFATLQVHLSTRTSKKKSQTSSFNKVPVDQLAGRLVQGGNYLRYMWPKLGGEGQTRGKPNILHLEFSPCTKAHLCVNFMSFFYCG